MGSVVDGREPAWSFFSVSHGPRRYAWDDFGQQIIYEIMFRARNPQARARVITAPPS